MKLSACQNGPPSVTADAILAARWALSPWKVLPETEEAEKDTVCVFVCLLKMCRGKLTGKEKSTEYSDRKLAQLSESSHSQAGMAMGN